MSSSPALSRSLGTGDAVTIGLGAMIGAGIFAAFAPAAAAAGSGLLIGLVIAAVIAFCNATSSAQLAAQYPTSGGTYVYGRERLGAWPGFLAGWGFVIGKTASCAAMAMTVAAYAVPAPWQRPVAVAVVLALAVLTTRGITRTAAATRAILAVVLVVLALVVVAGLSSGDPALDGVGALRIKGGVYGVLQSAGLLFFAFAGYARIATMGEEVRAPRRTIPRAILTALFLALLVYVLVAAALLLAVGAERVGTSATPLAEVLRVRGWEWGVPMVQIAAAAAALGALLALLTGIGRTSLAMARQGDLPAPLAAVHPVHQVPARAQLTVALVVAVLVLVADLREAIGFSSVGVLVYYLIANLAALTQEAPDRLYAKPWQLLGIIGCVVLVVTLPPVSLAAAAVMFALGIGYRALRLRIGR